METHKSGYTSSMKKPLKYLSTTNIGNENVFFK